MKGMDAWEWVLLAAAAFVAIGVLVRMMNRRRDELMVQLRRQMEAEQEKRRRAEAVKKEQEKQKAAPRPPIAPRAPVTAGPAAGGANGPAGAVVKK